MAPCHLFILLSAIWTATAAASPANQLACKDIKTALPGKVRFPDEAEYVKENKDYYNAGLADLKPACIAFPTSAQDVSTIVKILNSETHHTVQFVVKSGGHSPNAGAASTKDGVLIAMRHINGTVLDKAKSLAHIKPGGHWWDPMDVLKGTGQMAVGGRLGVVGIGGYLLQGGVSFLSGMYGMGGDNVVEYETVLANGSIVNIKASEHKDLVRAMRGGGSQFGIVTKFVVRTYPVEKLWVGTRTFTCTREQYHDALQGFITNQNKFPKVATLVPLGTPAGVMGKGGVLKALSGLFGGSRASDPSQIQGVMDAVNGRSVFALGSPELLKDSAESASSAAVRRYSMSMLYIDDKRPPEGAWGEKFNALPLVKESGSVVTYQDAIRVTNRVFDYFHMRTSFRTFTLPVQPNNPGFLGEIEDLFTNVSATYKKKMNGFGGLGIVLQPFPRVFGKASEERGGNAMGLALLDSDKYVLEITGVYQKREDDELMQSWGREFTTQLRTRLMTAVANSKKAGAPIGEYNPLFMNDAGPDQNVMGSYKEARKFAALQQQLDPKRLFSERAGGYKLRMGTNEIGMPGVSPL